MGVEAGKSGGECPYERGEVSGGGLLAFGPIGVSAKSMSEPDYESGPTSVP